MHDPQPITAALEVKQPLFHLQGLAYRYAGGPRALTDVRLDVAAGDRIALVGQNGSGKTTLIKQLCGLLQPDEGEIRYRGRRLDGEHLERSRLEIGLLFQDPDDQLFGHTLIDDVAFGPAQQGLSGEPARQAAQRALRRVHMEDQAYKAPHHLSFGQKKRAALAGLLAMQPTVLLLDEPTANLDPRQEEVFLDLLSGFDGTLICVSHDLIFLYELCDRAVVLDHGRIAHDYHMHDLVAQRGELRSHGLDFSFRLVVDAGNDANGGQPTCAAAAATAPTDSTHTPMVELDDYHFRYPDGTRALDGVDFNIAPGERLALVGENGAGKTTLVSCLLGLQQGEGTYRFQGRKVTHRLYKGLWREIAMVFQDSADQLFCPSVGEEIAFGLQQLGVSRTGILRRTEEALAMVHLTGFESRVPLHMSGGERKRLALACALAMTPKLLILDEPTAGLDPQGEELLLSILAGLDVTLLMVSHDMFFINALTCRTIVMHQGRILQDMPTGVFLKDPRLGNLNGLAYQFRQRGSEDILALQHEHEHSHVHRHLHSHPHRHDEVAHEHLHAHTHEHPHRYSHSHPGEDMEHQHAPRRIHDHDYDHDLANHDKDPGHHP